MKRFLFSVVLAASLILTSCKFDDSDIWDTINEHTESIKDHEQRILALEELCKQMNTNISALQTLVDALEKHDYITNIAPIYKDGAEIGYTISFAYSGTITIYHGQNGADGYAPQIGVAQDADGIYYWTLDGKWLLDANGNKIQTNGVNGNDGITPRLKIENDYWYVSYDNGATWQQLGKATGEDGQDGSTFFQSVTEDDEFVYFSMADGTLITISKHDKENIQFEDLHAKAVCCKNWDTNYDGELSYAEAAAVQAIGTVFSGNTNVVAFTELKYFTGISEIPANAFSGCTALWKVTLPQNIQVIGDYAFNGCNDLTNITIPKSVTSIGEAAFSGCTGELIINSKIVETDYDSHSNAPAYNSTGWLDGSKFTKLTIGDNIEKIGKWAFFAFDHLTSVTISDCVTSIESNAFYSCEALTSITIGNGVASIGKNAFYGCISLISISIPNGVASIEDETFYGCRSLTSITIPDSVTVIGNDVFNDCFGLTSVTIGNGVTSIGRYVFYDCSSLTSVYCKAITPPSRGALVFYNNASDIKIYVPRESVEAYKTRWNEYADNIFGYDF